MISLAWRMILAYGLPWAAGAVFVSCLESADKPLPRGEKLALGLAFGPGLLSFYLFYLGLLRISFTPLHLAPFFIAAAVAAGVILKKRGWRGLGLCRTVVPVGLVGPVGRLRPACRALDVLIIALLVWKGAWSFFLLASKPTLFDDPVSNYNYKAKVFYQQRSLVLDPEHPGFLGGHEPRYPDYVPLFKAWTAIGLGEWREGGINLFTFFTALSLGFIAYYAFRRALPPFPSRIFAYLLVGIPLLVFHAGAEHLDIVVAWYYFAGTVYLLRWIKEGDRTAFLLSGLLWGVGLSAKDEVMALCAGGALPVLILYGVNRRWKIGRLAAEAGRYLAAALVLNLPWLVVKNVYGLALGLPERFRRFEFHPEAFGLIAQNLFGSGNYNILWSIFIGGLIIFSPLIFRSVLKYHIVSIAGALLVTLSLFIFTPFFEYLLIGTTISRALLTIVPVIVLFLADLYAAATAEKIPPLKTQKTLR
jgi:hypothetical protein